MRQTFELMVSGPESGQRWMRVLPQGETCVGRSPRQGWAVTWDRYISREHFTLFLRDGMLGIRRVPSAANPILRANGSRIEKSFLNAGDSFRVGRTTFFVNQPDRPKNAYESYEFSADELADGRQLSWDTLSAVTEALNSTGNQKTLAMKIGRILVERLEFADRVAILHVERSHSKNIVSPLYVEDCQSSVKHQMDRQLVNQTVLKDSPVLHLDKCPRDREFVEQRWTYCVPSKIKARDGHFRCICIAGRFEKPSTIQTAIDRLTADVSFSAQLAQLETLVR